MQALQGQDPAGKSDRAGGPEIWNGRTGRTGKSGNRAGESDRGTGCSDRPEKPEKPCSDGKGKQEVCEKMKRFARFAKLGLILVTAASVTALTACSAEDSAMGKGKLVKVSICVSGATPAATAMREVFKPKVEELTDGRYNIEIYDSGVLGGEKLTYDYTRSGIIEMCVVGTPMWSENPKMSISDFPFVFRDVEHARHAYQGELGEYISTDLESREPLELLSWFPNGAREFSSSKPLEKLDDFKGQKLRMPNNPIHVKLAESLGANVVIMDMGEVFTALEQGVVDGQDNPLSTVKNEGWYEVQNYIYNTNHIVASLELFTGDEFWDDVSEEDKEIFRQAANEASDYAWDLYIEQLESDKQFMTDNGLTVTDLTEEDRERMIEMIQPVYDYLDSRYDWAKDVREMIAQIQ